MKLLFYSGGTELANERMDEELYSFVERKKNPRMTYIPACSWGLERYFKEVKDIYSTKGFASVECFPIDANFTARELSRAFDSDVIYLSGGNTYYFLKHLRQSGMLPRLRKYVDDGGVLMGLSAGAIIMTSTIEMAGIPRFDCDPNDVRLKNLRALKLVHFEFSPHYEGKRKVDEELKRYSRTVNHPIYACSDGSGIIVNGEKTTFIGEMFTFIKGEKYFSI